MTLSSWQPARSRSAPRGVTLIELLVGTVITSLILSAVGLAVIAVQRSYVVESQVRSVVESGRGGMAFLERTVRLAGYGVDPRFAFDFAGASIPSAAKDNYQLTLPSGERVVTDDLAFRYRDPAFMRRGSISGANNLTLQTPFNVTLRAGQPLIVSCHGGQEYVVVRLASAVTNPAATGVNVNNYGVPFPVLSSQDCLTRNGTDAPYVMLLHEVRVRLREIGGRSFLVAYRDFSSMIGNTNFVTLAQDVESFQVAYVMNQPRANTAVTPVPTPVDGTSNPRNWVFGDQGSTAADAFPDTATPAPLYATPYDDALRYNRHPANIRSVRLSFALRSADREATGRQLFVPIVLENAPTLSTTADGFYRTSLTSAVRVPNMLSRSFFNPPVRQTGDTTSLLNHNGG
jgi:type IV pilus assembly protein PilW